MRIVTREVRPVLFGALFACAGAFAQQPAANPDAGKAYKARCESCHGPAINGSATGPSILTYIRYHTDKDVSNLLTKGVGKMKPIALSDDERKALLSDLRSLAGTNPIMATGGYSIRAPGA